MPHRRLAVLFAMAAILLAGAPQPAISQNAGAQIILGLESSAAVNATYERQTVRLNGNITIDKPPKLRVTAYLISTNDQGWSVACSPAEFFFIDSDVKPFTCAVGIPPKAMNTTAHIVVHALCDGYGTTGEAFVNATVTVSGSLPTNGTIAPAPGPWGLNSPLEKFFGLTLPGLALAATAVIVPLVVAAFFLRRRKRRQAALPQQ
jgi:hypothetical protein